MVQINGLFLYWRRSCNHSIHLLTHMLIKTQKLLEVTCNPTQHQTVKQNYHRAHFKRKNRKEKWSSHCKKKKKLLLPLRQLAGPQLITCFCHINSLVKWWERRPHHHPLHTLMITGKKTKRMITPWEKNQHSIKIDSQLTAYKNRKLFSGQRERGR